MTYPRFRLGGIEFGGDDMPIKVSNFQPGNPEQSTQDQNLDTADGVLLGRDYLGSRTWSFDLYTDVHDHAEALDLEGALTAAWLDPEIRTRPGTVVPLDYSMIPGVWRRVYGRPRRWAGSDGGGVLTALGRAEMTADFLVVDHQQYGDVEHSISVGSVPSTVGGFIFPAVFPLTTAHRTEFERGGQFTVGGSAPAWPKVTITGPISNPAVTAGDWRVELVGSIPRDVSVIVDTAPWARSAVRSDGAPVGGMLHPSTRLSGLFLKPGHHEIVLSGEDLTGLARATVAWRDAYYSL